MALPNWKLLLLRALLIVTAGFWVYSPAFHGDWLWDEGASIRENWVIHDPAGLWKIWFETKPPTEYIPITVSLEWVEWHLWQDDTLGYHLTCVVLHVVDALLVWHLFSKFNLRLAWLGGLLFAIHPAMVESVAWIAELKNTLSLVPFLLAICAWVDYSRRGKWSDYFQALGLFLVAMLCKATMLMFPVLILLYAWWRQSRIGWSDWKASAPFFAISLVLGLLHVQSQAQNGVQAVIQTGVWSRAATVGWETLFCFFHCLLPWQLLPIYPSGLIVSPSVYDIFPWLVLGAALFVLWLRRESWGRHALLGAGFFLLNLAPVLGFIWMNATTMIWSLDHLLYIPIIGLIGLAVAGLEQILDRLSASLRPLGGAAMAAAMALLLWSSHQYAGLFAGPEKLWSYTVARNPTAWLAHNNLGNVYFETGRVPQAIEEYERALRLNPNKPEAHNNLGRAFDDIGRVSDAIGQYEQALKIDPHFALAEANMGDALAQAGRVPEAIDHYEHALLVNPHDDNVRANLAKLKALPPATHSGDR